MKKEVEHVRTSHMDIRKKIQEAKSSVSDEEFFTSDAYRLYLTDLTEAATKQYGRPLKVQVTAERTNPTVAFTDFTGVYINACNPITWSHPTRALRSLSIEGLLAHETGHNLFTENRIWHAYFEQLEKGCFYPHTPSGLTEADAVSACEIREAMQRKTQEIPRTVIAGTAHTLSNILEDGFVDARYSHAFPGTPARGIALNNLRFAETVPDIGTMRDKNYADHNIVLNLLIEYVRSGEVNNLSGYTGELLDVVQASIPWVDASVYEENVRARCEAANRILILLWPVMRRCFASLQKDKKEAKQGLRQSQPDAESGNGGGRTEEQRDRNKRKAETENPEPGRKDRKKAGAECNGNLFDQQLPPAASDFGRDSQAVPSDGSFGPHVKTMRTGEIRRLLAGKEGTGQIPARSEVPAAGADSENAFRSSNAGKTADGPDTREMERILERIARTKVNEELEREHCAELQQEALAVGYGNVHREVKITINRMTCVDQELIDRYHQLTPALLQTSRRLQKTAGAVLSNQRSGGVQSGLPAGKKLDRHALYRSDGKVFCNTRLPTEPVNLAVALLLDESGSSMTCSATGLK